MSLTKLFNRIFWHNNTTPAINEDNLNAMSKGLDDLDNRLIELAGDIFETIPELRDMEERLMYAITLPPYIGSNGHWMIYDYETDMYKDSGVDASITVQIASITMLEYNQNPYVINSGTDTDPVFHLFIPRGAGVAGVQKTGSTGLVDHYRMTFTDGQYVDYNVTNGADGTGDMDSSDYDPQGVVEAAGGIAAYAAKKPQVKSQTLTAGGTTITFSQIPTSGNYMIDFFTSTGINYTAINTATAGQVTLAYDAQTADVTVYCRIEEVL